MKELEFNKNEDADWHGNFFGDVMWTVEPIVILSSPMLATYIRTQSKLTTKIGKKKTTSGDDGKKNKSD